MNISTCNMNFGALPPSVRKVSDKILASGKLSLSELRALKKEDVGQIVDLRTASTAFPQLKEFFACLFLGIKREHIPVVLFRKFPEKDLFLEVKKMVDKCPKKTLIHCNSGLHRTNLFCEAILILSGKKSVEEAENSLIKNGFFKLRNIHKKSSGIIKIQMQTLQKCMEDFKKMFSQ